MAVISIKKSPLIAGQVPENSQWRPAKHLAGFSFSINSKNMKLKIEKVKTSGMNEEEKRDCSFGPGI